MEKAWMKGLGFGLTSGVITTLGMMVGLNAGTHSRVAVIGGIFVIAIGDAFSDALGMHISEESTSDGRGAKHVWGATISTLLSKIVFASIFVVPVLLLSLEVAVLVSVIVGLVLISVFSFIFALRQGVKPFQVVAEHVFIALLVVLLTHLVGDFVNYYFGGAS